MVFKCQPGRAKWARKRETFGAVLAWGLKPWRFPSNHEPVRIGRLYFPPQILLTNSSLWAVLQAVTDKLNHFWRQFKLLKTLSFRLTQSLLFPNIYCCCSQTSSRPFNSLSSKVQCATLISAQSLVSSLDTCDMCIHHMYHVTRRTCMCKTWCCHRTNHIQVLNPALLSDLFNPTNADGSGSKHSVSALWPIDRCAGGECDLEEENIRWNSARLHQTRLGSSKVRLR